MRARLRKCYGEANMVVVAQLARASACGAEGCGIVPHRPPRLFRVKCITFLFVSRGGGITLIRMKIAPIPKDEAKRLEVVHRMALLDTKPEERFDRLTKEAVEKLHVPISTITILDEKREWFKSCQGLDQI